MKFIRIDNCISVLPGEYYRVVSHSQTPDYELGMFTYKVFYNEPKAVWGKGCVLIQEASEAAALLFFSAQFPGYQVTHVSLTIELPL